MNGARFVHDELTAHGWTRRRLGRQRGPKVAQIDLARQLTEAIW